jgi:hypothetical protein
VEGRAQKDVAGDWTILRARRAPTIKLWSLNARSEGQSSHPLGSEPFAHEWEGGEEDRTSDGGCEPHRSIHFGKSPFDTRSGGATWLASCRNAFRSTGRRDVNDRRQRWSLDARNEGQPSHPLVSKQFSHKGKGGEKDRTSDGANLPTHPFLPHELGKWVR